MCQTNDIAVIENGALLEEVKKNHSNKWKDSDFHCNIGEYFLLTYNFVDQRS